MVVSRYIDPDSALQSFAVCNSCGPGFEASETCLAGLRSNSHAIVSKNKVKMFFGDEDLEVSQCRPCLQWYYSNTYGINKTCKACSFCDPDEEIIPCTPTADVVCGTSNVFNTTISTRRRSMKSIDTFATNRRATAQTSKFLISLLTAHKMRQQLLFWSSNVKTVFQNTSAIQFKKKITEKFMDRFEKGIYINLLCK